MMAGEREREREKELSTLNVDERRYRISRCLPLSTNDSVCCMTINISVILNRYVIPDVRLQEHVIPIRNLGRVYFGYLA